MSTYDDPSWKMPLVERLQRECAIVDDLMGGTRRMRECGETYLGKFADESPDDYSKRLKRSTLLPAVQETVKHMTGRVFADGLVIGDDVPPRIRDWMDDVDLKGNKFEIWAQDLFSKALRHRVSFAFVTFPRTDGVRTLAEEKRLGARPYARVISLSQLLGWRVSGNALTQFRFMETVSEDKGAFGSVEVNQIRVLEIGGWRVYRQDNGGKWALFDRGVSTLPIIPIMTFYASDELPLEDLAYLTVKHWQSQSDQDNLLHFARVPILFTKMLGEGKISIGANMAISCDHQDADAKFVEHTGNSLGAGRESLQDLEQQMRVAGGKLLQKDVAASKTKAQSDEEAAQELSPLQAMAQRLQDALDQVAQLFAMWIGLPDGGHVEVRGNFDADYMPEVSLPFLLNMMNSGSLSKETLFNEARRRNVVSANNTWADEQERMERQGPDLGDLPPLPTTKADPADELLERELKANGG